MAASELMATVKLTDRSVAAAKADSGKRLELWDEQTPGLCLRVSDTGKKVWVWRYRTLDGRQPRLTLGDFSAKHGLRWARDQVEEMRVRVRKGADPAAELRKAKAQARAATVRTFDDLADAYLKACEAGQWQPKKKRQRTRTIEDERGILRRHIRPAIGKLRLEDVTRPVVRKFLRSMVDRGIHAQTNRAQATVRQCFAFAISEELPGVTYNPATGFSPLGNQSPRARTLTDAELKALWCALVDPAGLRVPPKDGEGDGQKVTVGRPMRICLQLTTLLLQRRSEVAGMALAELNLDQGLWLIPAERMKGNAPHLVPLPPRAVELIREAMKLASEGKKDPPPVVFPSPRSAARSIHGDSVTHAMAELCAALEIVGATPHDLRRTGSTALTSERLGISPFIRSKVLGHKSDAGGGAAVSSVHYDANSYIAEKRRALEAWEGLLLSIVGERPAASNVYPLAGAVA